VNLLNLEAANMKISKFFVIALNICLLVLSVLLISTASSTKFTFGAFYNVLADGNDISGLNLIWVGSGFVLLAVGIFGLWSVLKESAFMMNLYTVILSLTLILQIVTATTSNTLSGKLHQIVSYSVRDLMEQYGQNNELTSIMDSIQIKYKCCGHNGPSDWSSLNRFVAQEYHSTTTSTTQSPFTLPTSCCKSSKKCKNYYTDGCYRSIYKDITRVVLMVKSVAMISSVLQIFGILAAYIFWKTLRGQICSRESSAADRTWRS